MNWWRLRKRDADLERELLADLQLEEEEQRENGVSPEEARYAAQRAFGNTALIKEHAHEAWGNAAFEHLLTDVRYGLRQLRRSPGFSAVAVLMLSLGIGANCTVFSFVDALFLKPLAVAHPERLVRIYAKGPSGHYGAGFSYPEFKLLREHASSYSALSIETERPQLHLVLGEDSMEVRGEFVSGNYFTLLGVQPYLGRSFIPEEDMVPGRNAVVVISDQLWKTRFNRASAVLGRVIQINSIPFKVIGVAPPDFNGDLPGLPVEVWIPSMMYGAAGYGCEDGTFNCSLFESMIGALAPGYSDSRAETEAASIMVWSATDWPERPSRRQLALSAASHESPDSQADDAAQFRLLASATAVLLLISCANLGGLLLARGLARRKEIAVRLSIGAAGSRIVRQLLTESLLLAFLGGFLGLMLSMVGKKFLSDFYATDSEGFHHLYDLGLDWRVLLYSTALSLMAGVVFGLVPALRALRHDLLTDLKDGGPLEQHTKGWLRPALITGQIALSMVLVIASGLLIRSASEVRKGTNFDPKNLLVLRLRPELLKYTQPQIEALVRRVDERLRGTPGVQSVAFMQGGEGLVWNWQNGRDAEVSPTQGSRLETAGLQVRKQDVSSAFFETLKIPIPVGREFNEQDRAGSPRVAIINQALAQRMWPASSAVGHNLYVNGQSYQVIGVCANLQPESSVYSPEPHLYLSYWQSNATREGDVRLAIRVFDNPLTSLRMVRRAIQSVDPNLPVGEDMPLSEQVSLEYMPVLLAQSVMSFCGLLAQCLSAMGLYSVLAFAVRMRRREIGIRMALGARRHDILALVIAEGTKLAVTGAAVGAVAALVSTRLLAGLLYGVRASDPATYVGVTGLLLLVALTASCLPASHAASIDPMQALRNE